MTKWSHGTFNLTTASQVQVLLKTLGIGVLCGLSFGLVMAVVSNGFVLGVQWLTFLRENSLNTSIKIGSLSLPLGPPISLIIAAFLLVFVKKEANYVTKCETFCKINVLKYVDFASK